MSKLAREHPLRLIREYVMNSMEIEVKTVEAKKKTRARNTYHRVTFDKRYVFNFESSSGVEKTGSYGSETYSVQALLFMWHSRRRSTSSYRVRCEEKNIQEVLEEDRKHLMNYITGEDEELSKHCVVHKRTPDQTLRPLSSRVVPSSPSAVDKPICSEEAQQSDDQNDWTQEIPAQSQKDHKNAGADLDTSLPPPSATLQELVEVIDIDDDEDSPVVVEKASGKDTTPAKDNSTEKQKTPVKNKTIQKDNKSAEKENKDKTPMKSKIDQNQKDNSAEKKKAVQMEKANQAQNKRTPNKSAEKASRSEMDKSNEKDKTTENNKGKPADAEKATDKGNATIDDPNHSQAPSVFALLDDDDENAMEVDNQVAYERVGASVNRQKEVERPNLDETNGPENEGQQNSQEQEQHNEEDDSMLFDPFANNFVYDARRYSIDAEQMRINATFTVAEGLAKNAPTTFFIDKSLAHIFKDVDESVFACNDCRMPVRESRAYICYECTVMENEELFTTDEEGQLQTTNFAEVVNHMHCNGCLVEESHRQHKRVKYMPMKLRKNSELYGDLVGRMADTLDNGWNKPLAQLIENANEITKFVTGVKSVMRAEEDGKRSDRVLVTARQAADKLDSLIARAYCKVQEHADELQMWKTKVYTFVDDPTAFLEQLTAAEKETEATSSGTASPSIPEDPEKTVTEDDIVKNNESLIVSAERGSQNKEVQEGTEEVAEPEEAASPSKQPKTEPAEEDMEMDVSQADASSIQNRTNDSDVQFVADFHDVSEEPAEEVSKKMDDSPETVPTVESNNDVVEEEQESYQTAPMDMITAETASSEVNAKRKESVIVVAVVKNGVEQDAPSSRDNDAIKDSVDEQPPQESEQKNEVQEGAEEVSETVSAAPEVSINEQSKQNQQNHQNEQNHQNQTNQQIQQNHQNQQNQQIPTSHQNHHNEAAVITRSEEQQEDEEEEMADENDDPNESYCATQEVRTLDWLFGLNTSRSSLEPAVSLFGKSLPSQAKRARRETFGDDSQTQQTPSSKRARNSEAGDE